MFELDNVSYRYADGTLALEQLNLSIGEPARVVILGANGSGKSTLLRLLSGLHFASEGKIAFEGTELTEASLRDDRFRACFRQSIGFVFQQADAQLFNPTVFDEVAFGPRQMGLAPGEAERRVEETLAFLGIQHLSDRAPFRLSGGEKRKVAIASVLSMNPRILMFDEPFLGLDPRSQAWLIQTLRQLQAAGKSTIIATHSLETAARVADTAIVLGEDHRLRRIGALDDILRDKQLLIETNLMEETAWEAA